VKKSGVEIEARGVAIFPLPCPGRISNFVGSDKAADRLRLLEEWKRARVLSVNPDFAQQKNRRICTFAPQTVVFSELSRVKKRSKLLIQASAEFFKSLVNVLKSESFENS
jgi:hypothetical protein